MTTRGESRAEHERAPDASASAPAFDDTIAATREATTTDGAPSAPAGPIETESTLARDADAPLARRHGLEPGTTVGRLMILRQLGAGGMGIVYAAYDPELDRTVALKLIGAGHRARGTAGARLYREAQALAKLSHPNVVAVHDVGTHGDAVWLSMELVIGQTLGAWLGKRRRGWRETLEVLKQAARGVAAAHAAGLLHRDLKPENIMVGDDGRVRVMDFGLARAGRDEPEELDEDASDGAAELRADASALAMTHGRDALSVELTVAGAMMGTPAYMAPEQFAGLVADERTDVFSLCATAWEALYGQRAFAGETLVSLAAAVNSGPRSPPARARVPSWLRRVVARGLAPRPEQRYAGIEPLLAALEADPTPRRRRVGLALAVALGVGAFALGSRLQRERALAACAAEGASVGATWNSDAESRLREGLLATAAPYAQIAADRVSASFSSQASAWSSARVRACQRARVDGEWDDDTLDRATWCLEDRRLELEALVEELSRADATIVQNAATAAVGLSSITPCLDPLRLAAMPALPSDRDAVLEVKRALWRVGAQRAAGAYATGLEEARDALARAEALSWAPLVATARWRLGSLLYHTGAYAEAERALEDAFFLARESGAQEVEFEAATRLTYTIGYLMARHDDGLRWRRHADIALTLMGEDETSLRRATHMHRVATVYYAKGAFAEAEAISERALATQLEALGAEHPDVASALNNLGSMQYATGAYDRARVHLSRALAIYEETLGPQHPHVADALINLANVNYFEGSYEEAKTLYRRALVIHERALGESHARVAESLNNLAELLRLTGEYAESKALAERALEIFERALGPKHPSVAEPLLNVATVSALTGDHARARNLYERALAIQQEAYGDEHVALAHALTGLAEVALAQARPGDAVTLAERAAKLRESGEAPPEQLADTRFVLARALCERGSAEAKAGAKAGAKASAKADASAGARARALAQEARAVYQAAKGKERALAEVDVFLASDCVAGGT